VSRTPGGPAAGAGRILWLASYPKSGNTWLRLLLTNLAGSQDRPARINELDRYPMAAGRDLFEALTGLESSELTAEEARRLRPSVYAWLSRTATATVWCKIHDAFAILPSGRPMIEPEATRGAIYIMRNPLDVAASFALHLDVSVDGMIERMADEEFRIGGRGRPQLVQRLGSWSTHVESWTGAPGIAKLTIRYEDLHADPVPTFTRIAQFAGLVADEARIRRALEFSSFTEARRQEDAEGFIERPPGTARFFRKGRVGYWREELTDAQAARIVDRHHAMMRRFDYLDREGRPAV
jgi:hypothetical protein